MLYVIKKHTLTILHGVSLICDTITQCDKQKSYFLDFSKFSHSMNLFYGRIRSPDHILEDCVDRICGHFLTLDFIQGLYVMLITQLIDLLTTYRI